jgi:uncharacterized membrane protein
MRKNIWMPLAIAAMLVLALTGCAPTKTVDPAATPAQTVVPSPAEATAAPVPAEPQATESAAGLSIPIAELDGNAHFYTADVDGVPVEVVVVKLADGSIRTAFNACQVCYDSGKGYFKQEGDELVCQNCGNRYTMDQVGLNAGGCNPAPIGEADRSSDGTTLTISQDVLKTGRALAASRKN